MHLRLEVGYSNSRIVGHSKQITAKWTKTRLKTETGFICTSFFAFKDEGWCAHSSITSKSPTAFWNNDFASFVFRPSLRKSFEAQLHEIRLDLLLTQEVWSLTLLPSNCEYGIFIKKHRSKMGKTTHALPGRRDTNLPQIIVVKKVRVQARLDDA
jgi:hypothetical protein